MQPSRERSRRMSCFLQRFILWCLAGERDCIKTVWPDSSGASEKKKGGHLVLSIVANETAYYEHEIPEENPNGVDLEEAQPKSYKTNQLQTYDMTLMSSDRPITKENVI